MNTNIEIKQIPKMQLAGINSIGFQNIASSYDKLIQWAAPKGLMTNPKMITIYYDSAKTVAHDKVRTIACLLLKEPIETSGEVTLLTLIPGKCIVRRMELGMMEFESAWKNLFLWMQENEYQVSDKNPFEIYHNNNQDHPEKKFIVDLCIPVK